MPTSVMLRLQERPLNRSLRDFCPYSIWYTVCESQLTFLFLGFLFDLEHKQSMYGSS
jgi:hypothetical protein